MSLMRKPRMLPGFPLKTWNINGIDVIRSAGHLNFKHHDPAALVSMTFYLIKDIKWIKEVWVYKKGGNLFLIFHIKIGAEIELIEKIMKIGMVRIKKHIKDIGLGAGYEEKTVMERFSYAEPIFKNCVRVRYYPIRSVADDIGKEI